jgi:hypothetical protein
VIPDRQELLGLALTHPIARLQHGTAALGVTVREAVQLVVHLRCLRALGARHLGAAERLREGPRVLHALIVLGEQVHCSAAALTFARVCELFSNDTRPIAG